MGYLMLSVLLVLSSSGLISHQQDPSFLNYQQPQGRFLQNYQPNSRNGFFPTNSGALIRPKNQQGGFQQDAGFLDNFDGRNPSSTPSFFQYNPYPTTRTPALFEISPRPFSSSSLQNRGIAQFNGFDQRQQQNSNFQYRQDITFPPSIPAVAQKQRSNPYLSSPQVPNLETINDNRPVSYVQSHRRPYDESNYFNPSQKNSVISRNNLNSVSSARNRVGTTVQTTKPPLDPVEQSTEALKKTKYNPVIRSTTHKPEKESLDYDFDDQKYSFTKTSKTATLNVKPLKDPKINVTHNGGSNNLAVKSLETFKKENKVTEKQEESPELDDEEYYTDEDYGVILRATDGPLKQTTTEEYAITTTTLPPKAVHTTTIQELTTDAPPKIVILTENFYLPKNSKENNDQETEEYVEYIEIEEDEQGDKNTINDGQNSLQENAEKSQEKDGSVEKNDPEPTEYEVEENSKREEELADLKERNSNFILGEAVVSVVTSKTVVNGSVMNEKLTKKIEQQELGELEDELEEENYPSSTPRATTENWVVVASVQTSRSVSGAHFLPFPHVEQNEKKQSLSALNIKKNIKELSAERFEEITSSPEWDAQTTIGSEAENVSAEVLDEADDRLLPESVEETVTPFSSEPTTFSAISSTSFAPVQSTESIIDKLDRVQSDLSLGVLSGEYPVLKEMSSSTTTTQLSTTVSEDDATTSKPFVLIRKFVPKSQRSTTAKPPRKPKTTKPSSTTESIRDGTQREDKKLTYDVQADELAALLPPGYKPRNSYKNKKPITTTQHPEVDENVDKVIEELVPKSRNLTTGRSYKAQATNQEIGPNLKPVKKNVQFKEEHSPNDSLVNAILKKFQTKQDDDLNKLLPTGWKSNETLEGEKPLEVIPLKIDELSKFLPPGFKPQGPIADVPIKVSADISKFLPPGFKLPETEKPEVPDVSSILGKLKFKEASDLLPPGFKPTLDSPKEEDLTKAPVVSGGGLKVVFPSSLKKKPGQGRSTTPKPLHPESPKGPALTIRHGLPVRATTEFTGWPSPPTTPFSIEKLLEEQRKLQIQELDIASFLPKISSSSSTSTTTSTTTTPRPTEPTICRTECNLAGTIRIVDGVTWSPELLDHNTEEWKNLATEVKDQLKKVYSNANNLKKWYKEVRIDSFSKGSVLVDYFVELANLTADINTLEIRRLFHEALLPAPVPKSQIDEDSEFSELPQIKEAFMLGKFLLDPVSTDFIVIANQVTPSGSNEIDDDVSSFLPQWAIAMIVIGFLSLFMVILFGVTVLVSRKKASKKKAPSNHLTADMLNELNKNHMGGLENYGADDFYNLDDTWNDDRRHHDLKPEVKAKRFSTAGMGSNANIYDSWRSQRHPPTDEFYDSHDPYNDVQLPHKSYQQNQYSSQYQYDSQYTMESEAYPYPNNASNYNNSRKYYRDYDPNF